MDEPAQDGIGVSRGRRLPRLIAWILIVVALVYGAVYSQADFLGDTANSRLATVYSLVHHGTWVIGGTDAPPNPFTSGTVDKCALDGQVLSTKPPMLPLLMTAEYVVLRAVFGWQLDDAGGLKAIMWVMNFTLVALPFVLILLLFYRMTGWLPMTSWARVLALVCLACGTQLPGYSTLLNNHIPAAASLMVMTYLAFGMCCGQLSARWWRFLLFGIAGGLTFTFDMPVTIYVATAGLYLFYRFPKGAATWGAAGILLPLAVHFGVMIAVTGSPLPVQMRYELYLYEGSYWRNPLGIDALNEPKGTYLFHLTFGRFGTFLLFPVLTLGLAGAVLALLLRDVLYRGWILAAALCFAVLTAYYVQGTDNYGGAAYGFRWHIASMPLLLLMAAPIWERLRRPWHWAAVIALLAVSIYSAWECAQLPWGVNQEWTARLIFGPAF
ncbi:MAG: hypothetical protein IT368_12235 [Candidatus Hydrogenedentes bacterium]|nr:hypothetical protein [Candidatus Hydrogenedentota bacterium]